MHHGGDQLRRERFVGIDMEAGFYAEKQRQGSRMRWIDRYDIERLKSDFFGRRSRSKRLLSRQANAQSRCKQERSKRFNFHCPAAGVEPEFPPLASPFLMLSTITDSLIRPNCLSMILPERSRKKVVGRPSRPP